MNRHLVSRALEAQQLMGLTTSSSRRPFSVVDFAASYGIPEVSPESADRYTTFMKGYAGAA